MQTVVKIGFREQVEYPEDSGIWVNSITEKTFPGTVKKQPNKVLSFSDNINGNSTFTTQIRIIAPPDVLSLTFDIAYVEFAGVKFVASMQEDTPGIILTLGGKYNGPTTATPVVENNPNNNSSYE